MGQQQSGYVSFNDLPAMSAQTSGEATFESLGPGMSGEASPIITPREAAQRATEALPNLGGTIGSVLGGSRSNPVGMALSAIGGAGGEGFRQALQAVQGNWDQVPPDLQSQFKGIVQEGLKQGGMEGAGRYIIGPLTQWMGATVYRGVLKLPKAVSEEFGGKQVADTLTKAGVPITRTGSGTEKVGKLLSESGKETSGMLAAAEAAGAQPVNMRPVVKSLERTREKVGERVVRTEPSEQVGKYRDAALADNPTPVPLTRAQTMKQAEQDLAVQAYKAEAKGAPVNSIETSMHEDLARGLREAIERRVPGVRNQNMRTQKLIGALKGIAAAEGRIANRDPVGMGDALALGTAIGGYHYGGYEGAAMGVLQEILTRPEIASRLGIAMDRLGRPMVTPQAMRVIDETLNQLQMTTDSKK